MIEINLLPPELRTKAKKTEEGRFAPGVYVLYTAVALISVLVVMHVGVFLMWMFKQSELAVLNAKWKELEPQRKVYEQAKKDSDMLSSDAKSIQQFVKQRINWSQKLNKLSLNLPSGVWFNEIALNQKDFSLRGSAVSLQKEELSLINKFMANLKDDQEFFNSFNSMELGSVQRRTLGGYDIIDFVLSGKLK